jgi:hypothetical protein
VLLLAGEGNAQDVEADDTVKVPQIGCSDAPSSGYGCRRDEPVVRPDVLAGCGELGPDPGVCTGGEKAEGERGERGQGRFDEGLTAGAVLRTCPVYAVQQFRGGDGGDPDLLIRPELYFQAPAYLGHRVFWPPAPYSAFKFDENGGV